MLFRLLLATIFANGLVAAGYPVFIVYSISVTSLQPSPLIDSSFRFDFFKIRAPICGENVGIRPPHYPDLGRISRLLS